MELEKKTSGQLTPQQESYLEVENHCCLCGTELVFEHDHNSSSNQVKEKAQCPCCNIQLKEKEFLIH